jgi:lipopolysaccharide/colanic/teichoic acid biosynthesis glycosyltransferase
MKTWQAAFKRGLDITAAGGALIILSPLIVPIAIIVRLTSSGKILFRQQRLGRAKASFTLYKFRTMVNNAPDIRNEDGSTWNAVNDPRVTRFGGWLRNTSLDELPQLFNVLSGSMSLVGPRPDQVDQGDFYTEAEWGRTSVKPGMTGFAQINGRNSVNWTARKQMDLQYVAMQSLQLDLTILLRTIPYVLRRHDVFAREALEIT